MLNKRKVLTANAFYARAMLAWLCLIPAIWVFRFLMAGSGKEINVLFQLLLLAFVGIAVEMFYHQPAYFLPSYSLYRYWYAVAQRPLGKSQFYSRVVAYYMLLVAGVVSIVAFAGVLQYSIAYFFMVFVLLVLLAHFSRYLIPSYSRYTLLFRR